MSLEHVPWLSGLGVPDPHCPIGTAGGKRLAVGRERHRSYGCRMPLKRGTFLACRRIPQFHGLVPASGGSRFTIWRDGDGQDSLGVPLENGPFSELGLILTCANVPEAHVFVAAGRHQELTFRRDGHGSVALGMLSGFVVGSHRLAGGQLPEAKRAIAASGYGPAAIRAEGDGQDRL